MIFYRKMLIISNLAYPKICKFARLNMRLYLTWVDGNYGGKAFHRGPREASMKEPTPPKAPQKPKMAKNDHKHKGIKKMNRINYQGLFGQFHSQVIVFRFEVHMGTLSLIKGTVEGQKW